jgi:DNA invertase Pin-like site-specific DNA recombinase
MNQVIALLRVSTAAQAGADRSGLPAQREVVRQIAHRYHLTIIDTVELTDVSGTAVLHTPEMQNLLRRIEDPTITGLVAKEFSRVMRPDRFADMILLDVLAATNTLLYLPDGPVDLSSGSGRLLGGIRALMAGEERRQIVDRMKDAKEAMRRSGKSPDGGRSLPTGIAYDAVSGWTLTPAIETIKALFTAVALESQINYRELGRRFGFARNAIPYILRNPIYKGERVWAHCSSRSVRGDGRQARGRRRLRDPGDVIRVRVFSTPPVSPELWDRVQDVIDRKRDRTLALQRRHPGRFAYIGRLRCAVCDEPLYAQGIRARNTIRDYYYCKSRRPDQYAKAPQKCRNSYMQRTRLEPVLDQLVGRALLQDRFLADLVEEQLRRSAPDTGPSRQRIEGELVRLTKKRARILDAFVDQVIDRHERDQRLDQVEEERQRTRALLPLDQPPAVSLPDLREIVQVFVDWPFLSPAERRSLLAALGVEISVDNFTVTSLTLAGTYSQYDKRPRASCRRCPSPSSDPRRS